MQNLSQIFVLCNILLFSFSYAEGRFSWLEDIRSFESSWNYPVVVSRPVGGYIGFWGEREEMREEYSFPPEHYFYRIIDANGKIVVDKKELSFWRVAPHPRYFNVSFSSKSMLWLDSTRLLIIAWKSFGHYSKLERILMSSKGEIAAGPDTLRIGEGVGQEATLVKDSKERVYAVDFVYGLKVMQVYPEFSEVKSMSLQKYKQFRKKYPAHTFSFIRNPPAIITSEDKLLICNRIGWGYTPPNERSTWNMQPNRVFCILADLGGNFLTEPVVLDVAEYAFRKIPGIHLGGYYYASHEIQSIDEVEAAAEDMDLSRLPNGDIILSVTGEDETEELCVYQIKFNQQGKVDKPNQTEVVNPQPFAKDKILPVFKIVWLQSVRTDLILFGFDEDGNFYSEREVWKEERR